MFDCLSITCEFWFFIYIFTCSFTLSAVPLLFGQQEGHLLAVEVMIHMPQIHRFTFVDTALLVPGVVVITKILNTVII